MNAPRTPAEPRSILVTGASGYLGTCLVRELISRGHTVGALVRRPPPEPSGLAEVLVADVSEPIEVTPGLRYSALVHLAAANDVASRDPALALRGTTLGTKRVLDFAARHGIDGFVYVSTTQVYGVDHGDIDEQTPTRCRNDYALSHLFAEQYVAASDRSWVIARPANIFGAPASRAQERWTLVPSCFCKEAHESATITLLSSGRQQRDFLGSGDVAALLASTAERTDTLRGRTVNLTSGQSIRVLDVAHRVAARYAARHARECRVTVRSEQPAESPALRMHTSLREELGLHLERPQSMDEEIDRTFAVLETP